MRPHGRARISRSNPEAQGVCDRCGARYTHKTLQWQFDWAGARLQNKYILVCPGCLDVPQENLRTIVLPPDPRPIANPRPEQFTSDDNPISGLGWDVANLFSLRGPTAQSAFFGLPASGKRPENFSTLNQHFNALLTVADSADAAPTTQASAVYLEIEDALVKLIDRWKKMQSTDLPALNSSLKKAHLQEVDANRPLPAAPADDSDGDDEP